MSQVIVRENKHLFSFFHSPVSALDAGVLETRVRDGLRELSRRSVAAKVPRLHLKQYKGRAEKIICAICTWFFGNHKHKWLRPLLEQAGQVAKKDCVSCRILSVCVTKTFPFVWRARPPRRVRGSRRGRAAPRASAS